MQFYSIYLYLFNNKPYSIAKSKNSGTGRTRLTALTAALRNGKNENESSYNASHSFVLSTKVALSKNVP